MTEEQQEEENGQARFLIGGLLFFSVSLLDVYSTAVHGTLFICLVGLNVGTLPALAGRVCEYFEYCL